MAFTQVGIEAVVRGLADFQNGTQTIRRQMGLTGSATLRATKQSQGFTQSLAQTGQSIRNFGNQVLILGFQLTFLASGAMVSVISQAARFEQEMTKINTLVGVQADQVAEWSDQLLELGPALGKVPTELAEGLFFVTSAGIRDSTEAMEVLESASKAAAIGMGDVKDVANAVTSAMQAYSDTGLTAADATDILTATVREGKTQADELAPSIGRVIPLAAEMGVSFQEVGAFIATFTRLGVPAAVAVTSLRSALTAILKPSSGAKDALEEYGLTMDNVRTTIEEKGLATALITLSTILGDDDEAFGKVIGSARGLTGVLGVTGGLVDEYRVILDNLNNSQGITAEGFETVAQTTAFMADQAKASLQVVAISFGEILLPGINAALTIVRELALSFAEFGKANPALVKIIGLVGAFVTVLGPLLIISGLIVSSIGTLITAVGALGTAFAALNLPILAVVAALTTAGALLGGALAAGFKTLLEQQESSGEQLAWRAYFWGEQLMVSFAEGVAAAASAVIDVLIQIGETIAYWLQAFSPPRLLPDIDKWGKATMQAWLDGFLEVDFGIFNTLSDRLENFIRTLNIDETRVVPEIREMRKALLDVVALFGETGEISEKAISKVAKSIGKNNAVLTEYIETFLKLEKATQAVAEAQEELNQINIKYDKLLDPIADQLKEIDDIRQDEVDKLREEELQAIIDDPRAPQRVKELAQLELKQIALKKEQRTLEDARDTELDAANEKLLAAQAEQEALEEKLSALDEIIKTQEKENSLIKEQIDLLERLAKQAKKAGEADFAGFPGGLPGDDDEEGGVDRALTEAEQRLKDILDPPPEKVATLGEKIEFALRRLGAKISAPFDDVIDKIPTLGTVWADAIANGVELLESDTALHGRIAAILVSVMAQSVSVAGPAIAGAIFDGIKKSFTTEEGLQGLLGQFLLGGPSGALTFGFLEGLFDGSIAKDLAAGFLELGGPEGEGQFGHEFAGWLIGQVEVALTDGPFLEDLSSVSSQITASITAAIMAGLIDLNAQIFPISEEIRGTLRTFLVDLFSEENKNNVIAFFQGLAPDIQGTIDLVNLLIGTEGGTGGGFNTLGSTLQTVGGILDLFDSESLIPLRDSITEARDYINDTLIPTIEVAWNNAMTTIDEAIKTVEGFLSGAWKTTIEIVESFLRLDLTTAIESVRDLLLGDENSLGSRILEFIDTIINPFIEGIGNLISKVDDLIDNLQGLWDMIVNRDWKIPNPFKENSPSDFEVAMTHAAAATDNLTDSLQALNAIGLANVNGMSAGSTMASSVPSGISGGNTSTINFGGQTINNGMDMGEFMLLTQQVIRNEL
jgi:TP901 family phage tail tape measure protein